MPNHSIARSRPALLRVSFKCDLHEVRAAVAAVHDFLAKEGWNAEDLMSFDLTLVEACNNAVQHARGRKRTLPVVVEAESDTTQVKFRVHDHTAGFDWPDKIELPPADSESGRGLFLITTLMDEAGYFRGREENILFLRKARK